MTKHWFLLCASLLVLGPVEAQVIPSYRIGTTYSPLLVQTGGCYETWYSPTVYPLTNGQLHMLAQGYNIVAAAPGTCSPVPSQDAFYSATREDQHGCWSVPGGAVCSNPDDPRPASGSSCPEVVGGYSRCLSNHNYSPTNPGPIASPSVIQAPDGTYVMAFVGGNADNIAGHVYWATSSDGINWSYYGSWTPLLKGKYIEDCTYVSGYANGISHVQLVFNSADQKFYFFMQYTNYWTAIEGNQTVYKQARTSLAYRLPYDTNNAYKIGSLSSGEVYHDGAWESSSGQFVWDYDSPYTGLSADGDTLPNGDHVLGAATTKDGTGANPVSISSFGFGAGDVKRDPRNNWRVHVYTTGNSTALFQVTDSLSTNAWRDVSSAVGASSVIANLPTNIYNLGITLWYGTLPCGSCQGGNVTDMFVWMATYNTTTLCQWHDLPGPQYYAPVENIQILPGTLEY
jgi:hypothetical protein